MTHPEAGTTAARPKRRVPFWDNARFACIVLVVLGHAVQRLTYDSDIAMAMYLVIYAFHMPAFAIISGYFSKSDPPSRRQMARILTDIVAPYVIFEGLWTLTKFLVEGHANPNPTQPSWTLWFLLALGIFRLVLPYLALLRWPLLWAFAISIAAGYLSNIDSTLSLSRTFGFLPLFVLGWWLRDRDIVERFHLLRRSVWSVVAAVATFTVAGWAAWAFVDTWREVDLARWLSYDASYADAGTAEWWAGGIRIALLLLALVLTAAFFALVPRGEHGWTRFGQYTMYVYLLHSFVLYPFRESGILRDAEPTWLWLPLVVVSSLGIALGLASRPVRRLLRPLVEPRPAWIFADRGLAAREGRRNDPTGSRRPREPGGVIPRNNRADAAGGS